MARIRHLADAAERFLGQMVDQYAVLELQPGADTASVRAAYRRLARQFHPDVNRAPEAAERMRALNAAYEALTTDATTPGSLAPASASASRTVARPAPASRSADFWYRWAASSAQGGGAVAVGSQSHQAITAGVVAGFFLLVAVFAGWAFAVARPTVSAAPATTASRAQTSSSSMQSTTGSAAAQLSANAAANAAAVRSNVGAAGTGTTSAAGLSGASSVAPVPTAAAPSIASASQPTGGVSVAGISLEIRDAFQETAAASQETAPVVQPEVRAPSQRSVMPSVPVAPSAPSNTGQSIQAVSAQLAQPAQSGDPSSATAPAAAATRALSNYDKAWTGYAGALRSATASGMLTGASAMRTSAGASAFLSSDAQLTMARTLYIQQQLAFNAQMAPAVAAAPASASRPDAAKAARAELRLRQAAELVAQAQATGIPAPAAQVKTLLDEAEQAHREWVAEWAKLLASAA